MIPQRIHFRRPRFGLLIVTFCLLCSCAAGLADELSPIRHQITGLFSRDREDDLRQTMTNLPDIKLVSIDFLHAEASFVYEPAKVFPNATPEQIVERFDNRLRQASRQTFGVKPLCAKSRDELEFIEIPVVGLDCKGCCLAAYEAIYRIDGVEQATASFKDGLVTAWLDPQKTSRPALADALKQKGVSLDPP